MKRFVDEIIVKDEELMMNIVHALETNPQSGAHYEVEMRECKDLDACARGHNNADVFQLKIFRTELML